jgi:hypothetical protein
MHANLCHQEVPHGRDTLLPKHLFAMIKRRGHISARPREFGENRVLV